MSCASKRKSLSRYLDDQVTGERREKLEAHLEACAECRALLETMRRMQGALGALEPIDPPPDLAARAAAAALASDAGPSVTLVDRLIPIAWPTAAMAVVVAILLLIMEPGTRPAAQPGLADVSDPVGTMTTMPIELSDPTIALTGEQ